MSEPKAMAPAGETIYRQEFFVDEAGRKVRVHTPVKWPGKDQGAPPPAKKYRLEFFVVQHIVVGDQAVKQREPVGLDVDVLELEAAFSIFDSASDAEFKRRQNQKRLVLNGAKPAVPVDMDKTADFFSKLREG